MKELVEIPRWLFILRVVALLGALCAGLVLINSKRSVPATEIVSPPLTAAEVVESGAKSPSLVDACPCNQECPCGGDCECCGACLRDKKFLMRVEAMSVAEVSLRHADGTPAMAMSRADFDRTFGTVYVQPVPPQHRKGGK